MQVNLRKAAKLSAALLAAAKAPASTVEIGLYSDQDLAALYDEKNIAFEAELDAANKLVDAAFTIRQMIGEANAGSGISAKLAQRAAAERKLTLLPDSAPKQKPDFAALKLERESNRDEERTFSLYGDKDMSVVVEEAVSARRRLLVKQVSDLTDELTQLNYETKIFLPDDVVALLTRQGLV